MADPPGLVFAGSLPDFGLDPRRFLAFTSPEKYPVAPLRRSQGGAITVIINWHHYADHQVAPLRRSQGGTITAITEWHYSTAH